MFVLRGDSTSPVAEVARLDSADCTILIFAPKKEDLCTPVKRLG
jgi:hypothetical protein